MKVREVIERLSTLDPELEVVVWAGYDAETTEPVEVMELNGREVLFQ